MSDKKNNVPGVPKVAKAPKNQPPQIRGGTAPVGEVKLVSPDQVKTRKQRGQTPNAAQPPAAN